MTDAFGIKATGGKPADLKRLISIMKLITVNQGGTPSLGPRHININAIWTYCDFAERLQRGYLHRLSLVLFTLLNRQQLETKYRVKASTDVMYHLSRLQQSNVY